MYDGDPVLKGSCFHVLGLVIQLTEQRELPNRWVNTMLEVRPPLYEMGLLVCYPVFWYLFYFKLDRIKILFHCAQLTSKTLSSPLPAFPPYPPPPRALPRAPLPAFVL
jgi:hypothetical protein